MWPRLVLVGTSLVACGGQPASRERGPTALEAEIERELGARAGVPIRVRCVALPLGCTAALPDRRTVAIRLRGTRDKIEWSLDGVLVRAAPIEQYLRDTLADLGAPQAVACGPGVQVLAADQRIACTLDGGGTAFVRVRGDGSYGFELALEPGSGSAVSDADLVHMSKQLEAADEPASEGGD